jgi:hypothetical protein
MLLGVPLAVWPMTILFLSRVLGSPYKKGVQGLFPGKSACILRIIPACSGADGEMGPDAKEAGFLALIPHFATFCLPATPCNSNPVMFLQLLVGLLPATGLSWDVLGPHATVSVPDR